MKNLQSNALAAILDDEANENAAKDVAQEQYSIGDLAREFGVTLRALRFYEDKNLLSPRRDGLNRIYSKKDRTRLKLILLGKRTGFSLVEIREMLELYEQKDTRGVQLKAAHRKFADQLDNLKSQRRDLDAAIQELSRTVETVSGLLREQEARTA